MVLVRARITPSTIPSAITQPIGQGDIFANANTIILMGRTRHNGHLGRALSVSLDEDGELSVGYSSGATVRFTWDRDHFERVEYGLL